MGIGRLDGQQRGLLEEWLPGAIVARDHSWGLVGTAVLEVVHGGCRYVVKAGDASDRHLAREIRAHREWLEPWTSLGRAPGLVQADPGAKLLVTRWLAGELVEGSAHELDPGLYRQAGELLALFHAQLSVEDAEFEAREKEKALGLLDTPHRIEVALVERLRAVIDAWPTPPSRLVPTHGDWQPRNWLAYDGELRVIDFGRADLRPALTDFGRLAAQQFRGDPTLERAFVDGYGADPRESAAWRRHLVREAVGTAAWAYQVGDEAFERQGHRMVAEALTAF